MEGKIYNIEDYRKLLELQKKYDEGLIDEDEMSLDEMDELYKLYLKQIKDLRETLAKKLIQRSRKWYK